MLVGSLTFDHRPSGYSRYNSALLFQPGSATVQAAFKLHLVPFGEYVPLIETFPWLTALTPYHGTHIPSLDPGTDPVWLSLGPYRVVTAICFEDTVPQVVRRYFREAQDGPHPDLLVNLSNDGWFRGSSEHDMHLAVSVFRAVEHRVPLARAANMGVSAIVDGNGRVVASLPKLKEGVLAGVVPLDDRAGTYSTWGDWLGQSCLAVTIGLVPLAFLYPRLRRR
jgi:apolipoprotein N-acyltransferase